RDAGANAGRSSPAAVSPEREPRAEAGLPRGRAILARVLRRAARRPGHHSLTRAPPEGRAARPESPAPTLPARRAQGADPAPDPGGALNRGPAGGRCYSVVARAVASSK